MPKKKPYIVTVKLRINAEYDGDAIADAHQIMQGAVTDALNNFPRLNKRWESYAIKKEAKCLA
jgi:hypothetical protein